MNAINLKMVGPGSAAYDSITNDISYVLGLDRSVEIQITNSNAWRCLNISMSINIAPSVYSQNSLFINCSCL